MIEVEDGGVSLGGRFVFRHLGFRLAPGQTLALLGRNGRGKTTLLRALLGLQRWTEGCARLEGSTGYVPQRTSTPFDFTVLEVVLTGRARHLKLLESPGVRDYDAAREALATLGMLDFVDRRIEELSGGERQLVFTARALASACEVLILDEPTSALDFHNQDMILSTLRRISKERGLTIVFASHYPQHALQIADQVLLMEGVEDHLFGPVDKVMTERHLSRLYEIPIRRVVLHPGTAGSIVPVFSS
ncbi:MAG: ABC transporter ATP-binding protein [Geminicoccaceae bacterium]